MRRSSFYLLLSQTHMTCNHSHHSLQIWECMETENECVLDEGAPEAEMYHSNDDNAFLECKILYTWPAVGWIEGEVVKRNVEHSMKIASAMVHFFVFYNHDDDTSKRVINPSNYNKWISRGSSLYYCTHTS